MKNLSPKLSEWLEARENPQPEALTALDRVRLERLRRVIARRLAAGLPCERLAARGLAGLERARRTYAARLAARDALTVEFPKTLPISVRAEEIRKALATRQVIVVQGDTGSGKTTQLPKIAFLAGQGLLGRIGCAQPRRLAAVGMACRVAEELKVGFGRQVGAKVRFEDNTTDDTIIKFMTDGILLAETQFDRGLFEYDTLIIDEAHERNLNVDFLLGYLKTLLPRRPELRVIVSSATLNAEAFSAFFGGAPIFRVEGRSFPIEDFYLPPREDEDLSSRIARAVDWVSELDPRGDILAFLPGEREIREAAETLVGRVAAGTEILPLYARAGLGEQRRVFQVGGRRRIILATNVAETSITIPGIHYVIDSGLVRLNRYHPRSQVQSLQIEQVSKAAALQRRGRCGRVADGVCVRLYDEETFREAPEQTDPEILRSSLAGVVLRMKVLGLPPIDEFPLIDPPRRDLVREALRVLTDIGAIDDKERLTPDGRDIAAFPVDPHLAKTILHGRRNGALDEALVLTAFLSMQDIREYPAENRGKAEAAHRQWRDPRSDFVGALNLWNFLEEQRRAKLSANRLRRLCKDNFLNARRAREWRDLVEDLAEVAENLGWKRRRPTGPIADFHYDLVHQAVLAGQPLNVGVLGENKQYRGPRERAFYLFPGSTIAETRPKWVMAFVFSQTTRLFARTAAEIQPEWVELIAPALCRSTWRDVHWDARSGFVYASETVVAGGLILREGRRGYYGKVDPVGARNVFIRDGLVPADLHSQGGWLPRYRRLLETIRYREIKLRRPDSLLDLDALAESFDKIIPPDVCSTKALDQWLQRSRARIVPEIETAEIPQLTPIDWDDYPDEIDILGQSFSLRYAFEPGEPGDGFTLLCPSDLLPTLPDWAADWPPLGHLAEKTLYLLRSLPKSLRQALQPLGRNAEAFVQAVKEGEVNASRPLAAALSDFFSDTLDVAVPNDAFNADGLPAWLTLNVAETGDNDKIVRLTRGMPPRDRKTARAAAGVRGVRQWVLSGSKQWPNGPLPERAPLGQNNALAGFPALVDEGETVGRHVFLDAAEAALSHRRGLVRLFKILNPERVKDFRKHALPETFFRELRALGAIETLRDDLADAVVRDALTGEGRVVIRDPETFAEQAARAAENLYAVATVFGKALEDVLDRREQLLTVLRPVRLNPAFADNLTDIDAQTAFLFRPGFLRDPVVVPRYPRYLKALKIRADRLRLSAVKDTEKSDRLAPYQERFDAAYDVSINLETLPGLRLFAWALQDYRISVFAPEVGPFEKISPARLDQAWENARKPA